MSLSDEFQGELGADDLEEFGVVGSENGFACGGKYCRDFVIGGSRVDEVLGDVTLEVWEKAVGEGGIDGYGSVLVGYHCGNGGNQYVEREEQVWDT